MVHKDVRKAALIFKDSWQTFPKLLGDIASTMAEEGYEMSSQLWTACLQYRLFKAGLLMEGLDADVENNVPVDNMGPLLSSGTCSGQPKSSNKLLEPSLNTDMLEQTFLGPGT